MCYTYNQLLYPFHPACISGQNQKVFAENPAWTLPHHLEERRQTERDRHLRIGLDRIRARYDVNLLLRHFTYCLLEAIPEAFTVVE